MNRLNPKYRDLLDSRTRLREPATASEILRELLRRRYRYERDLVIPRCWLTGWEADLLVIRKSGWAEEVEIKVSAADFRAEWLAKADKHEDLLLGGCRRVGYTTRRGEARPFRGSTLPPEAERIVRGRLVYVREGPVLVRRFFFAMPASLAERLLPEVPPHCGVLSVGANVTELRPAPVLKTARKLTDAEQMRVMRSAYTRFWRVTLGEDESAETIVKSRDSRR